MDYIRNPIERGKVNRLRVYQWFVSHPCGTNKDCSEALDLTQITIGKHARAIRKGWRPDPVDAPNE